MCVSHFVYTALLPLLSSLQASSTSSTSSTISTCCTGTTGSTGIASITSSTRSARTRTTSSTVVLVVLVALAPWLPNPLCCHPAPSLRLIMWLHHGCLRAITSLPFGSQPGLAGPTVLSFAFFVGLCFVLWLKAQIAQIL